MLVTFSCPAHADITMFGDVATRLIRMMGHSGSVPSAILAANVPDALNQLQTALATTGEMPNHQVSTNTDDEEIVVSLQHRALPLLDLLAAATAARCNVMWDRG
jgi:hypothetical protein